MKGHLTNSKHQLEIVEVFERVYRTEQARQANNRTAEYLA